MTAHDSDCIFFSLLLAAVSVLFAAASTNFCITSEEKQSLNPVHTLRKSFDICLRFPIDFAQLHGLSVLKNCIRTNMKTRLKAPNRCHAKNCLCKASQGLLIVPFLQQFHTPPVEPFARYLDHWHQAGSTKQAICFAQAALFQCHCSSMLSEPDQLKLLAVAPMLESKESFH